MKNCKRKVVSVLLCGLLLIFSACSAPGIKSENLMLGITAQSVGGTDADAEFIDAVAGFSVKLFQQSVSDNENSLVSPLSVLIALALTANGAVGQTLSQMETALGGIDIARLNRYLYSYINGLPSQDKSKLHIANSIWFRNEKIAVERDFLQTNADYYNAAAYKSAFDAQTLKDINLWVKNNTDGLIDKILDEIPSDAMM